MPQLTFLATHLRPAGEIPSTLTYWSSFAAKKTRDCHATIYRWRKLYALQAHCTFYRFLLFFSSRRRSIQRKSNPRTKLPPRRLVCLKGERSAGINVRQGYNSPMTRPSPRLSLLQSDDYQSSGGSASNVFNCTHYIKNTFSIQGVPFQATNRTY